MTEGEISGRLAQVRLMGSGRREDPRQVICQIGSSKAGSKGRVKGLMESLHHTVGLGMIESCSMDSGAKG